MTTADKKPKRAKDKEQTQPATPVSRRISGEMKAADKDLVPEPREPDPVTEEPEMDLEKRLNLAT